MCDLGIERGKARVERTGDRVTMNDVHRHVHTPDNDDSTGPTGRHTVNGAQRAPKVSLISQMSVFYKAL